MQEAYPYNTAGIIDQFLFEDRVSIVLDIYFHEDGHPKKIHDAAGAEEAVKFREVLKHEVLSRNNTNKIWQVSGCGYAIEHKKSNCGEFQVNYKEIINKINKRTIEVKLTK